MPEFKKNPNPIRYKKSSGFKMKSPLKEMDLFGLKARRNRRWAKEDQEEKRQQSMMTGFGRGHMNE